MKIRTGFISLVTVFAVGLFAFSTAFAQGVRINEVNPSGGWIELHNTGEEAVDVSAYQFCNRPAYAAVGDLEIVSGETTIEPDGFLVVSWDAIVGDTAELGLYTSASFSDATAMVDYLAWGGAGGGREGVAVEAGLWQEGEFAAMPETEGSLVYSDAGETMLEHWSAGEATPGEANPGSE